MHLSTKTKRKISGLVSLVVVAAAAFYLVSPTRDVLSISVTSFPAGSARLVSTVQVPSTAVGWPSGRDRRSDEVVYGKVTGPRGASPKAGAVSVWRDKKKLDTVDISAHGIFRAVVQFSSGPYVLRVRAKFSDKWYEASKTVAIRPGRAYGVFAVLRPEGVFTIFPVGSY